MQPGDLRIGRYDQVILATADGKAQPIEQRERLLFCSSATVCRSLPVFSATAASKRS